MPITAFLDGLKFDPETKRVMGVAFEMTRAALHLTDRDDPIAGIIARKIIELAKEGERNPDLLCERALKDLRGPPPNVRRPQFADVSANPQTPQSFQPNLSSPRADQ
jgi:hypothetical protein